MQTAAVTEVLNVFVDGGNEGQNSDNSLRLLPLAPSCAGLVTQGRTQQIQCKKHAAI